MDTFLKEEANEDFLNSLVYTSSVVENHWENETLNIMDMVMKGILLFDKMLTAFLHISKF